MSQKDPMKIKFQDESGFRLSEAGLWHWGFSSIGVPCVEVQRYMACPDITLNFLAGVNGVKYANTLDAVTNTLQFLRFLRSLHMLLTYVPEDLPCKLAIWLLSSNFLNEMSIDLLYLSVYSPDLNPVEECFQK